MIAANRPDLYKEMDDIMTCGLCLEVWTEPRTLGCLHTFCLACLETLIHQTACGGCIDCPCCRTHIQVPEGGAAQFQRAFLWNSMKDTVDKFKQLKLNDKPNCTSCEQEDKQTNAVQLCVDCMQTLCTACLKSHNKFTSDHNLMACASMDSEKLQNILKTKADKCSKHAEKNVEYYCQNCSERLCISCAMVGHEGHTKLEIEKAADVYKDQLQHVLDTLTHRVEHYQECFRKVNKAQQNCTADVLKIEEMLDEDGEKAKSLIDAFVTQMKSDVRGNKKDYNQDLERVRETLSVEMNRLTSCVTHVQTLLTHGSTSTIINSGVKENKTYCDLLEELQMKHDLPLLTFDFQRSNVTILTQEALMGKVVFNRHSEAMNENLSVTKTMSVPKGTFTVKKAGQISVPFEPYGVACLPGDNVVVCESYGSNVSVYRSDGNKQIQLKTPQDTIAVDVASTGDSILVADQNQKSILEFGTDGSYLWPLPVNFQGSDRFTALDQNVFVTSEGEDKIYLHDLSDRRGSNARVFVGPQQPCTVSRPVFVAASPRCVAVSSYHNKVVHMIDRSTRQLMFTYTGQCSALGQLQGPTRVCLDASNTLFICDHNSNYIHVVSGQGRYLGHIDIEKDGLKWPTGLCVNSRGQLVVVAHSSWVIATYQYTC